ncbi:hypothetical protein RTM1035_05868 [Roseovarius sp. TM1035]|nr:hypothetical protein RTM1035_05868 [Roseovarius sp. TM1035]
MGLGALAGPLGVLVGFALLAKLEGVISLYKDNSGVAPRNYANFLSNTSHFTKISFVFNLVRLLVFMCLIAFEIWLSSKYLSAIFGFGPDGALVYASATILGCMAIGYSVIGGFPAALKTDYVQAFTVLLLILFLLFAGFSQPGLQQSQTSIATLLESTPATTLPWLLATLAVFATAVATQFYNIINTSASRNRSSEENNSSFLVVGFLQATVIFLILIIGVVFSSNQGGQDLVAFFGQQASGTSMLDGVLAALILIGLTSIIFTTVDSAIVSLAQLSGDLLGLDCDSAEDAIWPRLLSGLIGFFTIPFTIWLVYMNFPIMDVVFVILTPLGAMAAYLAASIFVAVKKRKQKSNLWADISCAFFVIAVSASQLANLFELPEGYLGAYTLVSFVPAVLILAYGLFIKKTRGNTAAQ